MMPAPTSSELEKQNAALLQVVIRLTTIILRNVVEQRELVALRGDDAARRLLASITPVSTVERLREVSIRCTQLGHELRGSEGAIALEGLGVQLATEAQSLERMVRTSEAND